MSNQLKHATSPYLLQHAENPVNWYTWCDEAFEKAKSEDKPIFLSIGYSTCHWCHVMAHESFEDEAVADILNAHFVAIKVDREERPDIDSVYMAVCQAFTGSGGWPMSVFMTWDKRPFFAGTYFPPRSRYGMPGFADLLRGIAAQWDEDRTELLGAAQSVIRHLQADSVPKTEEQEDLTEKAVAMFTRIFDWEHGGFGPAPKFPTPHNLLFLLLMDKRDMVEKTLTQMRKGGIFDQIGGGFSRYSTDKYFLAPHFEKMLYDNALLITAYTAAYHQTQNSLYLSTAQETAAYILREMTDPDGGFYSAQDADSDGVEGKYYTFTQKEVIEVLGQERGAHFCEVFDITETGNFEGVNIPNLLKSNETAVDFCQEKEALYAYRKRRNALHLDDKILLSWNALMIGALAMLYRVAKKNEYLAAAQKAQGFLEAHLCEGVQLYTSWRDGQRSAHGFLDDYAFYIAALIELYSSTLDNRYLKRAEDLCREAVRRFQDNENGGFTLCEAHSTELFLNPKETYDGAIPSGNGMMAYNLVRLYGITAREEYKQLVETQLAYLATEAAVYPTSHAMFLIAKRLYETPPAHITVVPGETPPTLPFFADIEVDATRPQLNGDTTYYVCKGHTCLPPSNTL